VASIIGFTAIPAHADTVPALPYSVHIDVIPGNQPLLNVCLTIKEIGFFDCVVVPNPNNITVPFPTDFVHVDITPTGNLLTICLTIKELNFGPECVSVPSG
jgi:hypothetical protein